MQKGEGDFIWPPAGSPGCSFLSAPAVEAGSFAPFLQEATPARGLRALATLFHSAGPNFQIFAVPSSAPVAINFPSAENATASTERHE